MSPGDRPKGQHTMRDITAKATVDLERDLHKQIENYLNLKGVTYGHARMDRKSTYTEGWPDFTLCWGGVPIAIECKVGDNKLTPEQERISNGMTNDGWNYYTIYNLEQLKNILFYKLNSNLNEQ